VLCIVFEYFRIASDCDMNRPGSLDPGAQPSVITTMDLITVDYYNRIFLFNVLNSALNRGYLDTMRVSPKGFSFRSITGWYRTSSVPSAEVCKIETEINL